MREYSFKPAPVRKTQTWAIKEDHLMRRGGSTALNLAKVTAASWNTVSYRGTRSAWLHLHSEAGTMKIEYTDHGGARDEFLGLIQAVLDVFQRVNPGLEIEYGYSAPWRVALFILGGLGTLAGLFFIFAGLTNMTGRGQVEATIVGGALVILMLPVAWSCRPNMQARKFSPTALSLELAALGGAPMQDPNHAPRDQ
ncbi:MAG: hypothetical protein NXH72_00370 [Hyphomonadaceae bacterium]|nr:hypothetical protein [Hyphomonadaceae bacterium]